MPCFARSKCGNYDGCKVRIIFGCSDPNCGVSFEETSTAYLNLDVFRWEFEWCVAHFGFLVDLVSQPYLIKLKPISFLNQRKRKSNRIKKTTIIGGLFDGECPYGDLFRTLYMGKTSHHYYVLNNNFDYYNRNPGVTFE